MELWNEYEGSTLAGTFRLERLLRPEGRSAFFSTTLSDGSQTVLRLIESHYDDDAIVARWDAVTGLKQEHLLGLKTFGHVVMDDTSLVYVVMEPSDADLGQILRERALTVTETRQVAESLVAAVAALHSIGLVHEHLQPINVLAVGETVKLRSDCVREAPEGAEGEAARNRDVYDLCLLLLQTLTLERNPDRVLKPAANSNALPAPFREILYNVLSGRWTTAAQVAKALAESAPVAPAASGGHAAASTAASASAKAAGAYSASSASATRTPAAQTTAQSAATTTASAAPATNLSSSNPSSDLSSNTSFNPSSNPPVTRSANGSGAPTGRGVQAAAQANTPVYRSPADRIPVAPGRTTERGDEPNGPLSRSAVLSAALAGTALLVVILLLWHFTHRRPTNLAAHAQMQTLASMAPAAAPQTPAPVARPQPASVKPGKPSKPAGPVEPHAANANWRVIAFTYNQSSQAQTKADRLAQRNPSLHFEVFSPRGHAPYLVAVNGFMTREDAMALRNQLRGNGFPRDMYAQNYGGR
jgi:eukaryotic-like serine/threonine-protein kinase